VGPGLTTETKLNYGFYTFTRHSTGIKGKGRNILLCCGISRSDPLTASNQSYEVDFTTHGYNGVFPGKNHVYLMLAPYCVLVAKPFWGTISDFITEYNPPADL
jgi:hypothetical protein